MHALQAQATPPAPRDHHCLTPVSALRPGQLFMRLNEPNEILAPMSYGGGTAEGSERSWAIVVAVNPGSIGYVVGQLISVRRASMVRPVREVRAAAFELVH